MLYEQTPKGKIVPVRASKGKFRAVFTCPWYESLMPNHNSNREFRSLAKATKSIKSHGKCICDRSVVDDAGRLVA